jgi:hypothetical protein
MAGKIVPIVEGDGEITAVPVLLHRLLHEHSEHRFQIAMPKNAHGCSNLSKDGGIEKFVRYAWLEPNCVAVIVIVDGDMVSGCPIAFAKKLSARVRCLRGPHPVAIVIANREYEAWFLASLPSLIGKQITEYLRFPSDSVFVGDPESVRDVKGWFSRQFPRGKAYKETEHQAPMTRLINLNLARNGSRSFRRVTNAVQQLLNAIAIKSATVTPDS